MLHKEFKWDDGDGNNIHSQSWNPQGQPEAVVCLVHGMGEHSGRYEDFSEFLTKKNWAVITYDQPGHGKTEGARGHVKSYDKLLDQVDKLLEKAKAEYPEIPRFIYGHSMGGNVVANYVLRRKPDVLASVITGPWFELAFQPPKFKLALAKFVKNIYPTYTEKSDLDSGNLSHDPEIVKAYDGDPLVHRKITTAFFFGVHTAGKWAIDNADKLEIPMLVNHGGDDKITSSEHSKIFVSNAGKHARLKIWDGMYHEIHNEINKKEVYNYVYDWMHSKLNV